MTAGRCRRTLDRPVFEDEEERCPRPFPRGTAPAPSLRRSATGWSGRRTPRYDEARTLFNAMIDKRPALIAFCASRDDVAAAIRFAREHDLTIAVRGGGHNGGGLGERRRRRRDRPLAAQGRLGRPGARTVRVGGGCVWGEVDAATGPHNLAVPTGIISSTGVGGLTLGGGHGYLARRHGLTIDNLLSAEMVLADGSQVTASANENPDLFWAIRGGGGNFGVVTEFTFQAHPLETVVGGPTFWAIEDADELLAAYREWLPSAPRNVMGFFNFHTIPPVAEAFPEELHLRKVCGVVWCIDASDEEAEKAMAPMLSIAEPLLHGVGRDADRGAQRRLRRPLRPRRPVVLARRVPPRDPGRGDRAEPRVERADARLQGGHAPLPGRRGGQRRRARGHGVRLPRRDLVAGLHRLRPRPGVGVGGARLDGRLPRGDRPVLGGRAYVNFMMDDEGQARVKATYGANYPRLAQVKASYDPDNVFRVNQNILPARDVGHSGAGRPPSGAGRSRQARGGQSRASAAAAESATAAPATKSAVTSVGTPARPRREPRSRYADWSASAERAAKYSPPVASEMALRVARSGTRLKPTPPYPHPPGAPRRVDRSRARR